MSNSCDQELAAKRKADKIAKREADKRAEVRFLTEI